MAYEKVVVYLFYNFMNITQRIPLEFRKVSCTFPVPRSTSYGVATSYIAAHCQLQKLQIYEIENHLLMK